MAADNSGDMRRIDSELNGKFLLKECAHCEESLNLLDLFRCELAGVPVFAARFLALARRVYAVVFVGSKPQVGGINTRWVVAIGAIMKHLHALWYWPKVENPRGSWGFNRGCGLSPGVTNAPIPVFIGASCPQPARIGLLDLREKPLWKVEGQTLGLQILRCDSNVVLHIGLFIARLQLQLRRAFLISPGTSSLSNISLPRLCLGWFIGELGVWRSWLSPHPAYTQKAYIYA